MSSTCGEPVTQMITTSAACATSALVAHSFAPAARMSARRERSRFTFTASGKPLRARLAAMPWPMSPRPMKPMR